MTDTTDRPTEHVTVDEFEAWMKVQSEKFFEVWRAEHEMRPADYPAALPAIADWLDQFLCDASD